MKPNIVRIHIKHGSGCRRYLVSGFREKLSGQTIHYHSHHPEAGNALIARADKSCDRISWKSGALPNHNQGELSFVFLAAMAGSKGGKHRFTLSAEDEVILSFVTPAPDEVPFCQVFGRNGARMRFEHVWSDVYNDHFGLVYLTIQDRMSYSREGISFSVSGENAGSDDWFMVFQYTLSQFPSVAPEPVLKDVNGNPARVLKITYDNIFGNCSLSLESNLDKVNQSILKPGTNTFRLGVPANENNTEISIEFYFDDALAKTQKVHLEPVIPRTIYILPFSHNDIGYTDLQANVLDKQYANIDMALADKQRTLSFPAEAQARWNLEVIWALEAWLKQASAEQKLEFVEAVKSGHIGLNALHNNLLSGLCHDEELAHHLDFAAKFNASTGIKIDTAAVTDIPGFIWGLVKALSAAGVKYLSLAPNNGDRVGHIYELGDKPFYWTSPSGEEKVLTWISKAGYALFHREKLSEHGLKKALKYVQELQDSNYPYSLVPLAYTIDGDNGTPDSGLPEFVKEWNNAYTSPRFIISTHAMFFHEFEKLYGIELPVFKGDMTGYWEDGAASSALETKLNRNAADRLQALENLYSKYSPEQYPAEKFYKAWQKVIFFDEHTWGAWNSTSDPDLPEVIAQWETKRQFARDADKLSRQLLDEFSESGKAELIQPILNTETILDKDNSTALENKWFRLAFADNGCSVVSLFHKGLDRELLAPGKSLGQYLYMKGTDRDNLFTVSERNSALHYTGDIYDEIVLTGSAEGINRLETVFRMYHKIERIDISVKIDKLAVREKESVHLAFPFALEGAVLRYDCAGVMIEPEKDQLPGACKNFFCPTGVVDISNPVFGISVVLVDNPLIEIGGITAELPWLKNIEPSTEFYAYVMNNYWHTNYKADQSGEVTFRYVINFHTGFNPKEIINFSRQVREGFSLIR
jgi:hypothetical protein